MKIKITKDLVDKYNVIQRSNEKTTISLPVRWYTTSKYAGFHMNTNGKGSYFGPNQMFGGPRSGELVLFDKAPKPFIAIITSYTQNWHCREGNIEFLCWLSDFWTRVEKGLIQLGIEDKKSDKEIFTYVSETFNFDKAVDISIESSKARLKQELLEL